MYIILESLQSKPYKFTTRGSRLGLAIYCLRSERYENIGKSNY